MLRLSIVCTLACCLGLWGCSGSEKPPLEMKIQKDDARSHTACRQQCEDEHAQCRNVGRERRADGLRQPSAGPQEVTRGEWADAYKKAQEALEKCDRRRAACRERCLE